MYRILRMTREGGNRSWHLFVMSRIFAESGILYTFTSLAMLIATLTVSVKTFNYIGQYIADAIVSLLMICRLALDLDLFH